ncbi:MAG: xylose isomerase [Planctomycetes bacterium]|nr:xylose isomerase [Planctomycetota bacterium]
MVLLGYNSNGFTSHRLEEAIEWLGHLGYRAVAITPDVGHLDPMFTGSEALRVYGKLAQAVGLQVVIETGARYVLDPRRKHRPNLLEPDASAQRRIDFLRQMVQWCEPLGAQLVSLWSGAVPEGSSSEEAWPRLVDRLGGLLDFAQAEGVRLALEPEPGHLVATVADWRRLHAQLGDRLGMSLDVGHLLVAEEGAIEDVAGPVRDSVWNVQLDDMRRGDHTHLVPGEGEVDWPAVQRFLASLPAATPACFELSRDSHRFHELAPRLISEFDF